MAAARRTRILSIIGTRPEAIKMAPVVGELARRGNAVSSVVCVTGQHAHLVGPVLDLFGIRADHDLGVMETDQTLCRLTGRLLDRLDALLRETAPDWVIAQGDTTTVLAASMAAFYHRIPFGHVEAGLRTGVLAHPFPEEAHRCISDRLATLLFAPTERARRALLAEGAPEERVVTTGNTVVDAVLRIAALPEDRRSGPLALLPRGARLVLVTAHRRESFGEPLEAICQALRQLAERFADRGVHFIVPVHPNPQVVRTVERRLARIRNLSLVEPLDYRAMVQLMKRASLILTDSGGLQEEAPTFRVPVLVMRETTERPEAVEAGTARLVGRDPERIVSEATRLLCDPAAHAAMASGAQPFGDGKAAVRIVDALLAYASDSNAPRPECA